MNQGMTEYTKWWIAHPWHTTKGMAVPPDCDCSLCKDRRMTANKRIQQANLCPYSGYECSKVIEDCETCLMYLESKAKRNADIEDEIRQALERR